MTTKYRNPMRAKAPQTARIAPIRTYAAYVETDAGEIGANP